MDDELSGREKNFLPLLCRFHFFSYLCDMETTKRIALSGLVLMLCLSLYAQMESHLTFRRYTTQDGLPQMQTERLWQDSRGYIYIGTLSGFVRFDGHTFTPFLKGRRLNIVGFAEVDDEVRALGFFRQWKVGYDEARPLPLESTDHWLLNNFNATSLPNGYLLLEDSLEQHRRLCRMTNDGIEVLLSDSLLDQLTPDRKLLYEPEKGILTLPLSTGVFQFRGKSGQPIRLTDKEDIYTLRSDAGRLLAFASDGIHELGQQGSTLIIEADWHATGYGLSVCQLQSGAWVVADEHSVYLCEEGKVRLLLSGINLIRDLLVDCWDRLWVATYQGVYCLFRRGFINHTLDDAGDIVRGLAVDAEGQLLMGTLNGKLLLLDSRGHISLQSDDPDQFFVPSGVCIGRCIYMAGNGDVVEMSTSDGQLQQRQLHLPPDRYQFVGRAWGRLIVGTRTSVLAYDPQSYVLDTLTTDILHPWCSASDVDGRLWVGSSSGLFCIDSLHHVQKIDDVGQKLIVSTLDADCHGHVFFASADSVFVIRRGGAVEALNSRLPQLCGHEVRALHVSPKGYLVVAVVDGLFVGRVDGEGQVKGLQFFNHMNGFTMTEALKCVMAETPDGTIWLPGVEQMTSFRPADLMAVDEADTYIRPPLCWWQQVWVWCIGIVLLAIGIWLLARWYEKLRTHRRIVRLQREKLQRDELVEAIRKKALEEVNQQLQVSSPKPSEAATLASDIVRMTEQTFENRLTLRTASGTIVVEVKDIAYFKADGNYSRIVTFYDTDTVLVSLHTLEQMLNPDTFVRADRSTLVNIHHVCNLIPRQRRCVFRSPSGQEVETTLLLPAFKRLQQLL